jgi:hypothetical protein
LVLSVAAVLLWGAASCADVFYTATPDDYASISVGSVRKVEAEYGLSPNLLSGLAGDAYIFPFADPDGKEKILLAETNWNTLVSTSSVYDPNDLSAPIKNTAEWGINIHGAAAKGDYLYLVTFQRYDPASNEELSGEIIRINMKNGYEADKKYSFDGYIGDNAGASYLRRPVGVKVWNDKIYVVNTIADIMFNYRPGEVVEIDADLNPASVKSILLEAADGVSGKNCGPMVDSAVELYGGKLYIACYGGGLMDAVHPWGDIWEVDLEGWSARQALDLKAAGLTEAYGAQSLSITNDGTAYLMVVNYDQSNFSNTAKIFVTTAAGLSRGDIGTEAAPVENRTGSSWQVRYDETAETLWVGAGSLLEARDKAGVIIDRWPPAQLGNNLYSIAAVNGASSGGGGGTTGGSGGGGCDAGAFGALVLAAVLASAVKNKCGK